MNAMNVRKVIELKGDYDCRFGGEISHGYSNIRISYGHIYAYKEAEKIYKILVYNTNEYDRMYRPHGIYTYTCQNGMVCLTYPDGEALKINTMDARGLTAPYGWDTAKKEKLRDVIESLK